MAAGKVCTGFSKPYVAIYSASGTTVTYSNGMLLARGVNVTLELDSASSDNVFYADNIAAETVAGLFTGGSVTLTVDGLKTAAEKLVLGLPSADTDGWTHFGDSMSVPNVGIGFVVRYQSEGTGVTYTPVVLTKCRFEVPSLNAATQEDEIDWQTQELNATMMRDDTTTHDWKLVNADQSTESAAEALIKDFFNIT